LTPTDTRIQPILEHQPHKGDGGQRTGDGKRRFKTIDRECDHYAVFKERRKGGQYFSAQAHSRFILFSCKYRRCGCRAENGGRVAGIGAREKPPIRDIRPRMTLYRSRLTTNERAPFFVISSAKRSGYAFAGRPDNNRQGRKIAAAPRAARVPRVFPENTGQCAEPASRSNISSISAGFAAKNKENAAGRAATC